MNKLLTKFVFLFAFLLVFYLFFSIFCLKFESNFYPIHEINIDQMFFGPSNAHQSTGDYYLHEDDNTNKLLEVLDGVTKEIILVPSKLDDVKYSIINRNLEQKKFSLGLDTDANPYVKIVYSDELIVISVPSNTFIIGEQEITTTENILYTSTLIASSSSVHLLLSNGKDFLIPNDKETSKMYFKYEELNGAILKIIDHQLKENLYKISLSPKKLVLKEDIVLDSITSTLEPSKKDNILDINKANFKSGMWTDSPNYCDDRPFNSDYSMEISTTTYEKNSNGNALVVSSQGRTACTYTSFLVQLQQNIYYDLSFDYSSEKNNIVKYYYNIKNNKHEEKQKYSLDIANNVWQSTSTLIRPNTTSPDLLTLTIEGDPDSTGVFKLNIKNLYLIPTFENYQDLTKKIIPISSSSNLTSWKITGCNGENFASTKIRPSLRLIKTPEDSYTQFIGGDIKSCASAQYSINFTDSIEYTLSFEYQIEMGQSTFGYTLQDSNEVENFSETIVTNDDNWQTLSHLIDSRIANSSLFTISFYSPSVDGSKTTNKYANVSLKEALPKDTDSYYLFAKRNLNESQKLSSVEWKSITPWKVKTILHGVKDSFLLAYPEVYTEKWNAFPYRNTKSISFTISSSYAVPDSESDRQAVRDEVWDYARTGLISVGGEKFISKNFDNSIRNDNLPSGWFWDTWGKTQIPEETHYKINNYGNAWWIDVDVICRQQDLCTQNEDGTYEISLIVEHSFNRYLSVSLLISGTTLAGCLIFLAYDGTKRWRLRRQKYHLDLRAKK